MLLPYMALLWSALIQLIVGYKHVAALRPSPPRTTHGALITRLRLNRD